MQGFRRNFKPFDILTEAQVEVIWDTILDILEKTGLKFKIKDPRGLQILSEAGCKIDSDTMVKFPRRLVTDCLSLCPPSFRIEARDSKNSLIIGGDWVSFLSTPGNSYLDIDTFKPRLPTREEFCDNVRIYDALPNLHMFHPSSPNTRFAGVLEAMFSLENYVAQLKNTTKPIWAGGASARILGDHVFPIAIDKVIGVKSLGNTAVIPPLTWDEQAVRSLIDYVEEGHPISITTGPVWGSSSPVTLSGAVVVMSAELAGGIVLAQLIRPGVPVLARTLSFPQNMRSGNALFGDITLGLGNGAFHQVWRRYSIPTRSAVAGLPNSKCMDFQSGYEKGMNALADGLHGASQIELHGCVSGQLIAHPVQAIMDDDIAGMIGRFLKGIEVSAETLAADLISQIGAGPDFYLNKPHTREWWQKEQFIRSIYSVADLSGLNEWLKGDKKSVIERAKEKMAQILATAKVSIPLTPHQEEEIERILAEAREFHRKRQGDLVTV